MTQEPISYLYAMFVRKKPNKSGVVSVQVIAKINGKPKLIKTIGSARDEKTIEELFEKGRHYISTFGGQTMLDFSDETSLVQSVFQQINSHTEVGTELLLGKIFDEVGFDVIDDHIFRQLVLSRLTYPVSKLRTSNYLDKYHDLDYPVQQIYRYMDKLHSTQKELVQRISYEHTREVLGGQVTVVFYDVTTLYFEIDQEDILRKTGFSKEGKHQNPQIVLGLLVSRNGYPLAYDIFEGNKFEGHTMLPVLDAFKEKYKLEQLVIIADSGLLSNANIEDLQEKDYEFILGARIKNEKKQIQNQILSLNLKNGESAVIEKDGLKLIVTYSESRARKDNQNREKGLRKLEKRIKTGKLTKSNINNRGYNKYLKMDGDINIEIDYKKYDNDAAWDGLKGYISNARLGKDEIIENYGHLWQIEKAFRISKTDLKIRPIYHRAQRRIEAHICISFAAYKIYKELERQLKRSDSKLSPEKAIEVAKTIYQVKANLSGNSVAQILLINDEQKKLAQLFNFG
ncbi:MAG: IS1634 family transposase [Draconibacterium sp.]|nr:IS1634 family transposase [Draconibacterium sp.]